MFEQASTTDYPSSLLTGLLTLALILAAAPGGLAAAGQQATSVNSAGSRKGSTLYVSKLGDNSDGSSWNKAFTTIQAALDAIPDDRGGHRIIVRPDTHMEANLSPAHKGARGAYNCLIGDFDGKLGSGATGWVVIDSGDPAKGFKSYDWWSTIRATSKGWSKEHTAPTFSAIIWDRWALRHLYATGADAGLFWDCTNKIEPFTVIVEDCVGIGRAFGGGVASCLSRADEPICFRRCHLWALDWWGDTGGAYVRVENKAMPDRPDVVFEDCTMVSPQCALKGGNFGFKTFMRILLRDCRLIAINFSQPQGTPIDGIIQSVEHGKYLHVDLEDCTLMGYKVFGVRVNKNTADQIGYTTKGSVRAYVQYQQEVPKGFLRLTHWPVETFNAILPAPPPPCRPALTVEGTVQRDMCEVTPVLWKDRLCLVECVRPAHEGPTKDYYLTLTDVQTGKRLARFAEGYGLGCAIVHDGAIYAFASRFENNDWNDVTLFRSSDLEHWDKKVVVTQNAEHLFNSSVCSGPNGFVMAYETNDRSCTPFSVKIAVSKDLLSWTKVPDVVFAPDRYAACPCIRFSNGWYYVLYLERRVPRWYFETYIARSRDLKTWHVSGANPVLAPVRDDEGINTSDVDLIEVAGRTYIYYTAGDQRTWMKLKRAVYDGPMQRFLESYFPTP